MSMSKKWSRVRTPILDKRDEQIRRIFNEENLSKAEIARIFGLSRQRVTQIINDNGKETKD